MPRLPGRTDLEPNDPDGTGGFGSSKPTPYVAIAKLLITNGADLSMRSGTNHLTPLEEVIVAEDRSKWKYADEIAKALLGAGADVHNLEETTLEVVVGNGDAELLRLLLQAGANPNVDNGGPLFKARLHHNKAMESLLLKYGATDQ